MKPLTLWFLPMSFPSRLIQLRKALGLTQQGLSDAAELHDNQIRRYEAAPSMSAQKCFFSNPTNGARMSD